jgi:site-specific DNA recombinase
MIACASRGYGYYHGHTTPTAKNKIYYYRCLGSDDYRYQGGRVCASKPVRADYLDAVVWEHITGLLADPSLIRAELDITPPPMSWDDARAAGRTLALNPTKIVP